LLGVCARELFHGLDLDDQAIVDQQINAESTRKVHAVKPDVDRPLPVDLIS